MTRPRDTVLSPPPPPLPQTPPALDPASPAQVGPALLDYLRPRLGAGPLRFAEGPTPLTHGWEAHVHEFRLETFPLLPAAYQRRLILRIYQGAAGVPRARHEHAAQLRLHQLGYPVPRPLLLEEDCAVLGGPFLVMEWVPGDTLLERLRGRFRRFLAIADCLAEMHLRLHALPAAGFPAPAGDFLDRRLAELDQLVGGYRLEGLAPGLDWLHAHRPAPDGPPSILHLDFHLANLMAEEGRPPVVLDWGEADVGDPHADVAMTWVLFHTAPVALRTWREGVLAQPARWSMTRRYLLHYGKVRPLDDRRLRYYLAWAALRRLAVAGAWLRAGPQAQGFKASSARHLTPAHLADLCRCFRKGSGVRVGPPAPPADSLARRP
ncbi:MAG TPA: phosphotransferase [Gemmataceae bacterium]|nr:phosphotransferase [Gemmataceae bacterium]